jgi:glycine dehydrogenase subunit 1
MSRYIPQTDEQKIEMLRETGYSEISELFSAIPESIKLKRKLNIPGPFSEPELIARLRKLAGKNVNTDDYACFLGAGAYDHYIPSVVRHMVSRSEFYTSYTPYQPEISQGMLQAIFEYQSMICALTAMDVSNASMYDGATALAEAARMACAAARKNIILVSRTIHPEYRQVLRTYGRFCGFKIIEIGYAQGTTDLNKLADELSDDVAAVLIQSPNFFGAIEPLEEIKPLIGGRKIMFIVCADPISLAILEPPGNYGADIAVGEGQPLGNPLSFGGPYLGYFAAKEEHLRKMPGRIVGQTVDSNGKRGFVLTIQAREQHIRREKATSNICSNQALNALAAAVYMSVMGKEGLKETAVSCAQKAQYACDKLVETGSFEKVFEAPFFREFVVRAKDPVSELNRKLLEQKIIGGLDLEKYYPELKNCWLLAVTEKRTKNEIDLLASVCEGGCAQ